MLARKGQDLRPPLYRAVIIHQFADHADCRREARQPRQVNGCFRMARAHENPAGFGHQRKNVPGPHEILRLHILVGQGVHRGATLLGRNPRGQSFLVVNGDGEGRAHRRIVERHHGIKLQPPRLFGRHGGADDARGVAHHEGHLLRRDLGGGADQVALVFPVVIVNHHHQFAIGHRFDCFFHRVECLAHGHVLEILGANPVVGKAGDFHRQIERRLFPRHNLRNAPLGDPQLPRQFRLRGGAISQPFRKFHGELLAELIDTGNAKSKSLLQPGILGGGQFGFNPRSAPGR